jgi:hypothetical protein
MSKKVRLTVSTRDGEIEVGRAEVSKDASGKTKIDATITNLKIIDQLGGTKIDGEITDYEKGDL